MTNISSLGVGSGLELQKLLDTLVKNERQQFSAPLKSKEANATEKVSAYGLLKSSVSLFKNSMNGLADIENIQTRSAHSSNNKAFSVSATSTATLGTLFLEVNNLGQRQSLTGSQLVDASNVALSSSNIDIGGGVLTVSNNKGDQFTVSISSDNSSLNNIAFAINAAKDNPGIQAAVVNADAGPVLVITAADVGTDQQLTITVSDDDGDNDDLLGLSQLAFNSLAGETSNLTQSKAAANAELMVNQQIISSKSGNLFKEVVEGVSVTVTALTSQTETATISENSQAISESLNSFIKGFNTLTQSLNDLGNAGTGDKSAGLLVGDSLVRSLNSQMRNTIFSQFKYLPEGVQSLSNIGVRLDREGNLSLDEALLKNALAENFEGVIDLLARDDTSSNRPHEYKSPVYGLLDEVVPEGEMTFKNASSEFDISISTALGNNTVEGVRDAINNAADNDFITASIEFVSNESGLNFPQIIIRSIESGDEYAFEFEIDNLVDSASTLTYQSSPAAIDNNSQPEQGVFVVLQSMLSKFLGAGSDEGLIDIRTTGLNADLERINDQRIVQESRLLSYEENLKARFASLDLLVSNLNSQGDFLLKQLQSIGKQNND